MHTIYSKMFKIMAVKKVLLKRPETTTASIAISLGVKVTTLHGWVKCMKNKDLTDDFNIIPTSGDDIEKSPCHWTAKERFEIIIESSKLPQNKLSEYCRTKGIFPHHLDRWKKEFVNPFYEKKTNGSNIENKKLKNEIKALNSELRRKEKALAEAAALLILKKKVSNLWGTNEDY